LHKILALTFLLMVREKVQVGWRPKACKLERTTNTCSN